MRPHATKDRQEFVPSRVCVADGTNHVPQPLFVPIFVHGNTPSSPEGASIHSTSQLAAGLVNTSESQVLKEFPASAAEL